MNDPLEKSNPTPAEILQDIVGTIREPLLVLDANLRVLAANRSFYKFFKVKAGETIGQLIYDLGTGNGISQACGYNWRPSCPKSGF